MQQVCDDIYNLKYALKTPTGELIEHNRCNTWERVAKALASVEPADETYWEELFLRVLNKGFVPGGRIISNAGAENYKPKTSLINCAVQPVTDSIEGIFTGLLEAGKSLAAGIGVGYCFSRLRPTGSYINGAGAYTSGPLPFMDIFNAACKTISSAGGRRGAQMGTMHDWHPDIMDFVIAKKESGRLRHFNLSVLISDSFMKAVKSNSNWDLYFPIGKNEELDPTTATKITWRSIPFDSDEFIEDEQGRIKCKVYKTIKARDLWETITKSTYDYAEPGVIFIDTINNNNPLWFNETLIASNPCAEQFLPDHGTCLLGSMNLTAYIKNETFDWKTYAKHVKIAHRMLDNVVDINGLPLQEQQVALTKTRRHGLGITGLGSTLNLLRIRYGSVEAQKFVSDAMRIITKEGWRAGIELAKEKGEAPILKEIFNIDPNIKNKLHKMGKSVEKGTTLSGRALLTYSKHFDSMPDIAEEILKHGCRWTHVSSIQPVGTVSMAMCNNVSNGIEPTFEHISKRNIILPGKKTKEQIDLLSYETTIVDSDDTVKTDSKSWVTTSDLTVKDHLIMQSAAQEWTSNSISKTINIPTDMPFEEFQNVYFDAWKLGLKCCATFRFNPEVFSGVIVRENDLENTLYEFTLQDGTTVIAKGSDTIIYDSEEHIAANLHDALTDGYYGKI